MFEQIPRSARNDRMFERVPGSVRNDKSNGCNLGERTSVWLKAPAFATNAKGRGTAA